MELAPNYRPGKDGRIDTQRKQRIQGVNDVIDGLTGNLGKHFGKRAV